MTEKIKATLRDSKAARWTALVIVSFCVSYKNVDRGRRGRKGIAKPSSLAESLCIQT